MELLILGIIIFTGTVLCIHDFGLNVTPKTVTVQVGEKLELKCSINKSDEFLIQNPIRWERHGRDGSKDVISFLGKVESTFHGEYNVQVILGKTGDVAFKLILMQGVKNKYDGFFKCVLYNTVNIVLAEDNADVHIIKMFDRMEFKLGNDTLKTADNSALDIELEIGNYISLCKVQGSNPAASVRIFLDDTVDAGLITTAQDNHRNEPPQTFNVQNELNLSLDHSHNGQILKCVAMVNNDDNMQNTMAYRLTVLRVINKGFMRSNIFYGILGIGSITTIGSIIPIFIYCFKRKTISTTGVNVGVESRTYRADVTGIYEDVDENELYEEIIENNIVSQDETLAKISASNFDFEASSKSESSSSIIIRPTLDSENYLNPYNYLRSQTKQNHSYANTSASSNNADTSSNSGSSSSIVIRPTVDSENYLNSYNNLRSQTKQDHSYANTSASRNDADASLNSGSSSSIVIRPTLDSENYFNSYNNLRSQTKQDHSYANTFASSNDEETSLNSGSSSSIIIRPTLDSENYLNPYNNLRSQTKQDNLYANTFASSNDEETSSNSGSSSSIIIRPTLDSENYLNPYNYLGRQTKQDHSYANTFASSNDEETSLNSGSSPSIVIRPTLDS